MVAGLRSSMYDTRTVPERACGVAYHLLLFTGISIFIHVLGLLWNIAHSEDCSTEIMDQALNAHIKILDYSCAAVYKIVYMVMTRVAVLFTQDRDQQKSLWLEQCLSDLKSDRWVLPAIKMMQDIFTMYIEVSEKEFFMGGTLIDDGD